MTTASLAHGEEAKSSLSYNQSMHVRLATSQDIAGIMTFILALIPTLHAAGNLQWDETYPNPEVFAEDIALAQLWVASINDDIAGVIAVTTEQYAEYVQAGWDINDPAIVVHRLAVNPDFQRKGIAAALLSHAETGRSLPQPQPHPRRHELAQSSYAAPAPQARLWVRR